MSNLLKNLYDKAEQIKGRRLIYLLIATFMFFLIIGFGINYFTNQILKNNEILPENESNFLLSVDNTSSGLAQKEGIITYIDPRNYPEDEISYYLADSSGKEMILLKADDQKLEVAEGLFVKVAGKLAKTVDGQKEVMIVEKVTVNN